VKNDAVVGKYLPDYLDGEQPSRDYFYKVKLLTKDSWNSSLRCHVKDDSSLFEEAK